MFRDEKGTLLRHINEAGASSYKILMKSGLYAALVGEQLLVSHKEVSNPKLAAAHAIIKPTPVPFISHPFEWSFSQLKDAALLTLRIQKLALAHGASLKDASAYNVQFTEGKPIFIDTLSFEAYKTGEPWVAYRQFCQHFLAPLALMAYTDLRLSQLLRIHLDGIPLDLAVKLLPRRARIKPGLAMHLVLHARAQKRKEAAASRPTQTVARRNLEAILENLTNVIAGLRQRRSATEWGDYYQNTNYSAEATDKKAALVAKLIKPLKANTALDMGGNDGRYSRVLTSIGLEAICADADPNAVEANYRQVRASHETTMLPLVVDLTNPGGALGWQNEEREPLPARLQVDVVMALAIVHHLAISNNLPLERIARYFAQFGPHLLIEFVPKNDSQVQKLLATRKDIFPDYTLDALKTAFHSHYTLKQEAPISGTKRTLLLFKRK